MELQLLFPAEEGVEGIDESLSPFCVGGGE
jgi:hypothetical protein